MLNNITRDETGHQGRKRLADSDRHSATHFNLGASNWQQTYQSSNNYIQHRHYGQDNVNFRPNRHPINKRPPQIDFDYAKRYRTQETGDRISENKQQYKPKDRSVRQPLHTY